MIPVLSISPRIDWWVEVAGRMPSLGGGGSATLTPFLSPPPHTLSVRHNYLWMHEGIPVPPAPALAPLLTLLVMAAEVTGRTKTKRHTVDRSYE